MRFDKSSDGKSATNIHLDGEYIGSIIELGANGIIEYSMGRMAQAMRYTSEVIGAMTDRQLLAAYLYLTSPGFRDHSGVELVLRNGRWGTCVCCPRLADGVHPESCPETHRYDHKIHSTRGGKFYEYDNEIDRATLVAALTT